MTESKKYRDMVGQVATEIVSVVQSRKKHNVFLQHVDTRSIFQSVLSLFFYIIFYTNFEFIGLIVCIKPATWAILSSRSSRMIG